MGWLYYTALVDGAGELRTCQIRAAFKWEGEEEFDEMAKALTAYFGTVRPFVQVVEVAEPAVTIILEGGCVKSTYSSQDNLRVEVFDLDLRSDGTPSLEKKVRAGIPGHMAEVEVVNHYDKKHGQ